MINYFSAFIVFCAVLSLGVYFTRRTGFIQIREFKRGWIKMFRHNDSATGLSSFSASILAIGGRIGTGNIAGVSLAIYLCGYGVIFWLWIASFFGMAIAFIETTLAQVYKEYDEDGEYLSGPMVYIERGLEPRYHILGKIYGILLAFTIGFMYIYIHTKIMTQSVLAFTGVSNNIRLELYLVSIIALIAFYIIYGGTHKVAKVLAYVIPVMLLAYVWLVVVIALSHISYVPVFFYQVISSAFTAEGVLGGGFITMLIVSTTLSTLSSEAGLGTSTLATGLANGTHPAQQGFASMITIFIDSVICSLTAFVVMLALNGDSIFVDLQNTSDLAMQSFAYGYDGGEALLLMFILIFTFTTIITSISYGTQVIKLLMLNKSYVAYKRVTSMYVGAVIFLILATPILNLTGVRTLSFVVFASISLLAINTFAMFKLRHIAFDAYEHYHQVGHTFKTKDIDLEYEDHHDDIWI